MKTIASPVTRFFGLITLVFCARECPAVYVPPDFYGEPYRLSIGWFENLGQIKDQYGDPNADVKFYSRGSTPHTALLSRSTVAFMGYTPGSTLADPTLAEQIRMKPVGEMAAERDPVGSSLKGLLQNFYLPWTGSGGAVNVQGYDRVVYEDIYPLVDMHFYSGSLGQKMAIVMRPGADLSDVSLEFTGQDSMLMDLWGNLKVYYNGRYFELREAVAYQVSQNNTVIPVNWSASYDLTQGGGIVRFSYAQYDPSLPLILQVGPTPAMGGGPEPNLCWATFLGGTATDQIESTETDAAGNLLFAGSFLSDFTTILNAPGTTYINGGQVIATGCFNSAHVLQWITYTGCSFQQNGLCITSGIQGGSPHVFVGGFVTYNDMITLPLAGAYNLTSVSSLPFSLAFISRFNTINGLLTWATYFMNGTSELRGMDVDNQGRLHIVGRAQNQNIPYTTLGGSSSWAFSGGVGTYNTLLARFNANNQLEWCTTYPGRQGDDVVCTIDGFTVGGIGRAGMPTINPGSPAYYQAVSAGGDDALMMHFNTSVYCDWATWFGGNGTDTPGRNSLTANASGDVYLMGSSTSTTLPFISAIDNNNSNGSDGFIARFAHTTRELIFSTFVNGKPDGGSVDANGNFYCAGTTADPSLQVVNYGLLYNDNTLNDGYDGCVFGFSPANTQFYGTFFGGDDTYAAGGEGLSDIECSGGQLLVGGYVRKQDPSSYQPLMDAGYPAYYDFFYEWDPDQFGTNQNALDGIFAALCFMPVGVDEGGTSPVDGSVFQSGDGALHCFGLEDGIYDWQLLDVAGKALAMGKVRATGGKATIVGPNVSEGIYHLLLQTPISRRSIKVLIQR